MQKPTRNGSDEANSNDIHDYRTRYVEARRPRIEDQEDQELVDPFARRTIESHPDIDEIDEINLNRANDAGPIFDSFASCRC
jgi:hypothetical protein